jgi:hypothetical protein
MFPYIPSVNGARRAHFPDLSQQCFGLPDEEYRDLCRAQDRERLASHTGQRGGNSRGYEPRRTAFQDAGLPRQQRHGISKVRAATRAALGGEFNFDDESYGCPRRHTNDYERPRGWGAEASQGAIPQRYLDEYDQRSHEYDEDHDADQFVADFTSHAPWRQHEPMDRYTPYVERPHARSHTAVAPSRFDSAYGGSNRGSDFGRSRSHGGGYDRRQPRIKARPKLTSRFSEDTREQRRRRRDRFFGMFHRR